jgi:hypothetical protein
MALMALLMWFIAALGGMFLLAVWLIEYDAEFQSAAATRLPIPVLAAHVVLALTGLIIWGLYIFDNSWRLADIAIGILLAVAGLGATMAVRWIAVYRAHPVRAGPETAAIQVTIPAERNFPVPVVIGHGIFAVTTLVLVLLTALHPSGGS